jgi:hypothetical protein
MRTGVAPSLSLSGLCLAVACAFPDYAVSDDEISAAGDPLAMICTDDKPSSAETGLDCGGGCPRCPVGQACKSGTDCETGSCADGMCQAPNCSDGFANGSETDVDCGGGVCDPCLPYHHCIASQDCSDLNCLDGVCAPASCSDSVRNQTETDVDCGGLCLACPTGSACATASDCQSTNCEQSVCVSLSCTDGKRNVSEADVDCGGPDCAPCDVGQSCSTATDCAGFICDADTLSCRASACDDEVLNGAESDIDCGGASCTGCADLRVCLVADDCSSGVCQSGLCVPSAPTGIKLPRTNWTYRASNSYSPVKPTDMFDGDDKTWWSSGAEQRAGMWLEIDMLELQPVYAVALETNNKPNDYPVKLQLYFSRDGTYGEPAKDGVYGAQVTKVNLESVVVARYVKIVLAQDSTNPYWWSVGEFRVYE